MSRKGDRPPPYRFGWERQLLASDLSSTARLVGLVLASKSNPDGTVPAEFSPSLTTLANLTGLGRSTVARGLTSLDAGGWIARERPDVAAARSRKETTRYRLTSPTAGLLSEPTSPTPGLEQSHSGTSASPTAGHSPERSQNSQGDALPDAPQAKTYPAQCDRHQDGPHAEGCWSCKRAREEHQAAEDAAAEARRARLDEWHDWRKEQPECEHGEPGGDQPHPETGDRWCFICRDTDVRGIARKAS